MTPENRQTEVDPEARSAAAPPTVSPVRLVPPPTVPPPPSATPAVPSSTIAPPSMLMPAASGELEECAIGSLIVGRYLIEKKLGQGGMGAVYLGRDRRLMDKRVVVKVLLGEFVGDEWVIRKFLQEKEALTRANHPGIVGILDAGELPGGKPFLVMEYIDGVTLHHGIPVGGLDLKRAGHLIRQVGSALSAAHDNGIYHRDLKPENIMLQSLSGGEEQVRIIDFGIAKVHDSLVADHTVAGRFGTYIYMSPEQFRVEEITSASDVYSMGAIAYEMVTGQAPFDPKSFRHLGDMYSAGVRLPPRELRRELSERAQKLILKALSAKPQDRFQSAAEFGEALAQALIEGGVRRVQSPSLKGITKGLRGQARFLRLGVPIVIVVLISLVVVVAASFIAPVFWRGSSKPQPKAIVEDTGPPNASAPTAVPTVVPAAAPESSLTYWLNVQKKGDSQANTDGIESPGSEIFESGERFRLSVLTVKPGYLYVLNEGATANGTRSFTMIYPTPKVDKDSLKLDAGRRVQTGWNTFAGQAGTEQFWMVWSSLPIDQLENASSMAFKNSNGRLTDPVVVGTVRDFLTNHANSTSADAGDSPNHRTLASADPNLLVKLLELQHH